MAVEIALGVGDTEVAETAAVASSSTPSAIVCWPKSPAKGDDRPDDEHVALAASDVTHEVDVDLQVTDGQQLELGEAGEPGPEVVEREVASQRHEVLDEARGPVHVLHDPGLGDLEDDIAGIGRVTAELAFDQVEHAGIAGG
jgi:hypothetical protein